MTRSTRPSARRELGELVALASVEQLHGALGQPHLCDRLAHQGGERGVGPRGVARAPKHDRVAALQGQCGAVHGDVRPRLVDHRDHAERNPDLPHLQATGQGAFLDQLADGVLEPHDLPHPLGDRGHPRLVQGQAVAQRFREPGCPLVGEILGIRLEHLVRARLVSSSASRTSAAFLLSSPAIASSRDACFAEAHTSATVRAVTAMRDRVACGVWSIT